MTVLRRIAACLVIAAQAVLALAVPHGSAHGNAFERREEIRDARDRHACRGVDGAWVLGIAGFGHRHLDDDHDGHAPDSCCPDRGVTGVACLDCGEGHLHFHVAGVDEMRDASRRWTLPPPPACGVVTVAVERCGGTAGPAGSERPERASRPPPSSRRALGSIVLRV